MRVKKISLALFVLMSAALMGAQAIQAEESEAFVAQKESRGHK